MSQHQPFTIAILAGGKSSRMGQNKALLKIGERTLIEHIIAIAQEINPAKILLITNSADEYRHLSLPMFADVLPDQGTVGGILTALTQSQYDRVLVMPCDAPFIQVSLAQKLLDQQLSGDYRAVVALKDDYPQSAFAVYHRACLSQFEQSIHNDQRKMSIILKTIDPIYYLPEHEWRAIDPQGLSFVNINTPDDLIAAQKLYEK